MSRSTKQPLTTMKAEFKMADVNVTEANPNTPLFTRFRECRKEVDEAKLDGGNVAAFAMRVADISRGISLILEVLQDDELRKFMKDDTGEGSSPEQFRPLFTPADLGSLHRLAIRSAESLSHDSERLMEWAFEYNTAKGHQERTDYLQALVSQPHLRRAA